ncbi:hypothetical protein EBZ80_23620 [bacterium]|nr:hypothetical protein [bacterium]
MNKIDINEEEGYILTVGVLLKSLKRFGWSAAEVEQVQQAIHLTVLEAIDKTREVVRKELAAYTAQYGFDETALFGLARTEYALRGIEIASELHRKRLQACN